MVYWNINENTLHVKWYQVKVGKPYRKISKDEVSLSSNLTVTENFEKIQTQIKGCMKNYTVTHELFIITTKDTNHKVFDQWGEPPKTKTKKKKEKPTPQFPWGSSIKVQNNPEYWPQRIREYIENNTTFLNAKQKKTDHQESPKKKRSKEKNTE